jgi:HEAT repeat protein
MSKSPFFDLLSSQAWAAAQQAARGGWRFDLISFALGFVAALLLAWLVYRYREQITQYQDQLKEQVNQLRQRLTAGMAARYSREVIEIAQTAHLWGALAALDQIYVEPQLHAPLARLKDETASYQVEAQARYPVDQFVEASDRLVIIGQPGSGRTTLLHHLLLRQATRLREAGESEHVPIYVYLPALDVKDESPSATRLVETAVAPMSRLVASGVTRWLQRQVEGGNALLLLDDWDQVPIADRSVVTEWIEALFAAHPGNRIVVVTGEYGYAPLIEIGLAPLQPVIWSHRQLFELTRRWVQAFQAKDKDHSPENGGRPGPAPTISYRLTPPTPLQATFELMIQLHGQQPAQTPAERMAQVMDLLLPPPQPDDKGRVAWPLETGYRALGRLALTALEQGHLLVERDTIQSTVTEALPPPQLALHEEPEDGFSRDELKASEAEKERRTLQVVDCCRDLTTIRGPIRAWGSGRYLFSHPVVAAYLAARHLADEVSADGVATIVDHADTPTRRNVLRFYVGLAPAGPLIKRLMGTPDDLFLNRLWTVAALLGAMSPGRKPWRDALMARLAQLLMNPRVPVLMRDRALEALVDSGEASVRLLLKQAASHPDTFLRAGATLGMGVLGREQDIPLLKAALSDAEFDVRMAAIHALGRLALEGSKGALELVVATLLEAGDEVQREAAELLAELGPEGEAVLRDSAQHEDLMLRRAAVYGLVVINEPWAREALEQMQREDTEWLVRNAASEALISLGVGEEQEPLSLDLTLPQADAEPWLIAWAAEQGEGVGVGEAARATLMRALREGEPETRFMAIETLERLADPRAIGALRQYLRDPYPEIRQATLAALAEISRRYDMTISSR